MNRFLNLQKNNRYCTQTYYTWNYEPSLYTYIHDMNAHIGLWYVMNVVLVRVHMYIYFIVVTPCAHNEINWIQRSEESTRSSTCCTWWHALCDIHATCAHNEHIYVMCVCHVCIPHSLYHRMSCYRYRVVLDPDGRLHAGKTEPEMSKNLKTETRERMDKCSILCTTHMRCSVYQGGAIF